MTGLENFQENRNNDHVNKNNGNHKESCQNDETCHKLVNMEKSVDPILTQNENPKETMNYDPQDYSVVKKNQGEEICLESDTVKALQELQNLCLNYKSVVNNSNYEASKKEYLQYEEEAKQRRHEDFIKEFQTKYENYDVCQKTL